MTPLMNISHLSGEDNGESDTNDGSVGPCLGVGSTRDWLLWSNWLWAGTVAWWSWSWSWSWGWGWSWLWAVLTALAWLLWGWSWWSWWSISGADGSWAWSGLNLGFAWGLDWWWWWALSLGFAWGAAWWWWSGSLSVAWSAGLGAVRWLLWDGWVWLLWVWLLWLWLTTVVWWWNWVRWLSLGWLWSWNWVVSWWLVTLSRDSGGEESDWESTDELHFD